MDDRGWVAALSLSVALVLGMLGFHAQLHPEASTAGGSNSRTYEKLAGDLTSPVGLAAGERGELFLAESGAGAGTPPRVIRLAPDKRHQTLASDFPAPLTGLSWHGGKLYVSYVGGVDVLDPGTGNHHPILAKLPAQGDYPNGPVAFGPDGKLYFAIGTATNAGVVGEDNIRRGWVKSAPQVRDIPCKTVTLRGLNFSSPNLLTPDPQDMAATGAYSPFGKTTARLQAVPGAVPCTGAVLRSNLDGTGLELVAWGLRNPVSLAFGPGGQLYSTMQGFRDWGARPIVGDHDYLYRIDSGHWYGWPDYAGGRSVVTEEFQRPNAPAKPLLAELPAQPPVPVAMFDAAHDVMGLVFPPDRFALGSDVLVALSGPRVRLPGATDPDQSALEAGPVIMRVNLTNGRVSPYLTFPGLRRPVALTATPAGTLALLDQGEIRLGPGGLPEPVPGTGSVWLIAPSPPGLGSDLRAIHWQWAFVGAVLSVAGVHLVRKSSREA